MGYYDIEYYVMIAFSIIITILIFAVPIFSCLLSRQSLNKTLTEDCSQEAVLKDSEPDKVYVDGSVTYKLWLSHEDNSIVRIEGTSNNGKTYIFNKNKKEN